MEGMSVPPTTMLDVSHRIMVAVRKIINKNQRDLFTGTFSDEGKTDHFLSTN